MHAEEVRREQTALLMTVWMIRGFTCCCECVWLRALVQALERAWPPQEGTWGFPGNALKPIRHAALSGNLLAGMFPGSNKGRLLFHTGTHSTS